jgi:DNA-binding NarL/FixJ family response regulator
MQSGSVIIADDHHIFRQGLENFLRTEGFEVVGKASNGQDAIRLARQFSPMVAILDVSMPLLNGIDAAKEIQKQAPNTRVILLTMHDEEAYVLQALRSGARGYVLKNQAASDLTNAIKKVIGGSIYLSPKISEAVVSALVAQQSAPTELLTSREKQVLQLIAEGKTTKEIATLLSLSVKTTESHRSHIMQRLNMHNVASLVRYAVRHGMIKA